MKLNTLLLSAAIPASILLGTGTAFAQVTIDTERTTPISTSSANDDGTPNDVTIATTGSVVVTSGTAVTVDSSNDVVNDGSIQIDDANDATGVNLMGGADRNYTQTGSIALQEDFTATDDDGDNIPDGPFAQGSGRTGILISGASPFEGNVTLDTSSSVSIEGNDSYAFRLMENAGLTGDATFAGSMVVTGNNSIGVSVEDQVIGNLANSGTISTRGENTSAISVTGDVTGSLTNTGSISNTGYRFTTRPSLAGRDLLGAEDLLQAGAAIAVHGNITGGVNLGQEVNDAGNVLRSSNITQIGSAPAVLIDGQGTPIMIGRVSNITDPTADGYDANNLYAFVNRGTLTANGTYDDINATAFSVQDATLTDGINNTGTMQATAFRSGNDGTADTAGETGLARVIVIGPQAVADQINNSGLIFASASESVDEIYADFDNIVAARDIRAVAIDIDAAADVSEITNTGSISAIITGRQGEAVAIRDQSGNITMLNNTGVIGAIGRDSNPLGESDTSFNLIALDFSANTTGVTINQSLAPDTTPDDGVSPAEPLIQGDVLLGSGDDTVNLSSGTLAGDLDLGAGADVLTLSGGSTFTGALTDSDGLASLSITGGSTLTQTASSAINVGSALVDSTSVFQPTLDGATGQASTLVSTGDITFEDGATIAPLLSNVISAQSNSFEIVNAGGNLNIGGDLASLASLQSPFLYNTTFGLDPNNSNALVVTLELRSPTELGLDSVQAASFNSAFEALQSNTQLANAFVNITDGTEFNQALNQLLPEFASASRQFVVANVDGAVGAVGTHLDNMRRSQDKPGGVWLQEFTYFADRDLAGLSEQYRGYGFGVTGGMDTAFGPFHTVGVNLGFASTEIEDVVGFDDPMDVLTVQLGAYAGFASGGLGVEAYGGIGYNDFEQRRVISIGDFQDTAQGDWAGTHTNASIRAGYDLDIGKRFWVRPAVSVDYLRLTEESYQETGATGLALDVAKRTSELGGATAMINVGARLDGQRTWLRPSVRFGYRNEFINDGVLTDYGFVGLTQRSQLESSVFPRDGFLLGFSVGAGSKYSSFSFDFDSDIRDGFIRHTGRLIVRLIF